jgi:peptidoglycan-N-acetylglucosamine deacetylase
VEGVLTDAERRLRRATARRRLVRRRRLASLAVVVLVAGGALLLLRSGPQPSTATASLARVPVVRPVPTARVSAVARVLARTPYVASGTSRRREVALTFDDGPGPDTPALLRLLQRRHVPATFFLTGRAARRRPAVVLRERRAGFALGDHTDSHAFLSRLAPLGQAAEIDAAAQAITALERARPVLFRPPYGAFDQPTLALLRARGMLMVLWSVDSEDYRRPGTARIVANVLGAARAGAIVLLHDGGGDRSQTLAALPAIVRGLRDRGYRLVTVPRLLRDDPPPSHQPPPSSLAGHR